MSFSRYPLTTQVPKRVRSRFAIAAICGFVMFTASFALATVFRSSAASPVIEEGPVPTLNALESAHQSALDTRLHLHMKRLHAVSGGF